MHTTISVGVETRKVTANQRSSATPQQPAKEAAGRGRVGAGRVVVMHRADGALVSASDIGAHAQVLVLYCALIHADAGAAATFVAAASIRRRRTKRKIGSNLEGDTSACIQPYLWE